MGTPRQTMHFSPFTGCAAIAFALVILQLLFFVLGLKRFLAEERVKHSETSAQVLSSLEDSCAVRKCSATTRLPGTGHRSKKHKKTSTRSSEGTGDDAARRPPTSGYSPESAAIAPHKRRSVVGTKPSNAHDDIRSKKPTSGRSKHAGTLPRSSAVEGNDRLSTPRREQPSPQVTSRQASRDGHAMRHSRQKPSKTTPESGRRRTFVSSGCRFYAHVVEKMARDRAKTGQVAPPTTPVDAVFRP